MWEDYFYYDETSPSCLRWKIDRWVGRWHKILLCEKGSVAGGLRTDKYWAVKLHGKNYKCHRIIHELVIGPILNTVDHKDGDNSNNKVDNLRDVEHDINCRNRSMSVNNTSGKNGVHYFENAVGNGYWVASWREDNVKVQKCFSVLKLGFDKAKTLASECRDMMITNLNCGYTERHGE